MLRMTIAAVAVLVGITLIGAPVASADICAHHDANHYVTACAKGPGGNGPILRWVDKQGKTHFNRAADIPKRKPHHDPAPAAPSAP